MKSKLMLRKQTVEVLAKTNDFLGGELSSATFMGGCRPTDCCQTLACPTGGDFNQFEQFSAGVQCVLQPVTNDCCGGTGGVVPNTNNCGVVAVPITDMAQIPMHTVLC